MVNQDQILSMLRSVLAVVGGWAVGRGYATADQIVLIGGLLTSLVPLVWGMATHTKAAKAAAVQLSPTEQVYTTDTAVAEAAPGARLVERLPPAAPRAVPAPPS